MKTGVVVPYLGSITEATITKWLKQVGDAVEYDEPIVELEVEKVSIAIPSPVKGVLVEQSHIPGVVVQIGTKVAVIEY